MMELLLVLLALAAPWVLIWKLNRDTYSGPDRQEIEARRVRGYRLESRTSFTYGTTYLDFAQIRLQFIRI